MKIGLRSARIVIPSAFVAVALCSTVRVHAQIAADPSADGAAADIGSPNIAADPDASQGVSSGSGSGRSLLRQQSAAGSRVTASRASSSASRLNWQNQAALYTATAANPKSGTNTNAAPRPLYSGTVTPATSPGSYKSVAGRSLGMGLSSGFSTGTLLGSRQATSGSAHSSSIASISSSGSSRKAPSAASSSLRGMTAQRAGGKSRLEGLSQKYTFQAPRSRFDKAAPESSFRSRHLSDQP